MKHFGDITKINGHEVPIVDIITGGSPCQDLSIAGKRAGLEGERSGLFYEQIRIIKEMHDECRRTNQLLRPRFQSLCAEKNDIHHLPSIVQAFRKQGHPMNQDMGQGWEETEVSDTLNCFDNSESHSPTIILEGNGSRPSHHGDGFLESDVSYTLNTAEQHCVAYEQKNYSFENGQIKTAMQLDEELAKTLNCMHDPQAIITSNFIVRRITPLEAERLQGFPDNWTNIGEWVDTNGKKHKPADTPRYKALGNSLCLPFWEWLAERVVEQLKDETDAPTMASLFDGIGGFPLVFQRKGCQPVWASEIEEFPIAVTKFHFPEVEERNE